jgi:hypothetical protein
MGFILTLIIISAIISAAFWRYDSKSSGITSAIVCSVLSMILMVIVWTGSYHSYLDIEEKRTYVADVAQTVKTYARYGVQEFQQGKSSSIPLTGELTDLKYNSYQAQLGEMIQDLRGVVVRHNRKLAGKIVMNNSWYWSWCIIMPDDTRMLHIEDYLK